MLVHLRQRNTLLFSTAIECNEALLRVELEKRIFRELDQSVKNLFVVCVYHLCSTEEYRVAFLAEVETVKRRERRLYMSVG